MGLPPAALESALFAARKAALKSVALRWDNRLLQKNELPDDLMTEQRMVLIYLLPRVFSHLELPLASFYNSLWQYGRGKLGELKREKALPGEYYWKFKLDDFRTSATLTGTVASALKSNAGVLPSVGTSQGASDKKWEKLRAFAKNARDRFKDKEEWSITSPDYRQAIVTPDILLDFEQISTWTYSDSGENPLKSDAYAALGPCAVRVYLMATFRKKRGDQHTYVQPHRLGARIWDQYNFNDNGIVDALTGLVTSGRASQFLGSWANASDGSIITLVNDDFVQYRDEFRIRYNKYLQSVRSTQPILVCRDFSSFSNYLEHVIETNDEYIVAGL